MKRQQYRSLLRVGRYKYMSLFFGVFVLFALICTTLSSSTAHAAATVPTKMNFQGRLTGSSGTLLNDGTYNMRLRLYTVSSAGTSVWSEDRLVSASTGVAVTSGIFSIQLGDVTSLPASLFASGNLYLEVELPTPATSMTASPIWTEGAMTPRSLLATSAYAFNSETLDGLDSAAFAQVGGNNTFTGTNTFKNTSTTAFSIQNASGLSLLTADTSTGGGGRIYIGQTAADSNATFLAVDSYNVSADPSGGFNGAIYYNSANNKLRCYEGGAWKDCITAAGSSNPSIQSITSVPGTWGATAATSLVGAIVVSPLYLPGPMTVNQIRIRVTTALGATGDAGIYNSSGNLVINGGSNSVSVAVGVKNITPVQAAGSRTLPAGQYYVAVTWNASTGVIAGGSLGVLGMNDSGVLNSGGGTVLPSSISLAAVVDSPYIYAMSLNQ